jgi:hypothetical protein
MLHGLARIDSVPRAFPPLMENPYPRAARPQDPRPEERAACQILALADRRPPLLQRVGVRVPVPQAIARFLWLHRQALEAEIAGDWPLADFCWSEADRQWGKLPPDAAAWSDLVGRLGADGAALAAGGRALRERLTRELLVDSHLAVFNGLTSNDPRHPSPRAQWHFERAHRFAAEAGLSHEQAEDLDIQPDLQRIAACLDDRQWGPAIEAASALAQRYASVPRYQALLVRVHELAFRTAVEQEAWSSAVEHIQWLLANDAPGYGQWEHDGAQALYAGAQKTRDSGDWIAAARCGGVLSALYPGRADYRAFAQEAARKAEVDALAAEKKWTEALDLVRTRARANPDSLDEVERYPSLCLRAVNATIGSPSDEASLLREAGLVGEYVKALEQYLQEFPECASCYDAIGLLYQIHAVKLANADRPSQALSAIALAMAYRPDAAELRPLETQIEERLAKLQQQVGSLPAFDRSRPGAALHLVTIQPYLEEARQGAGPRDAFRRSGARNRVEYAREYSRARRLWLLMGLPRMADGSAWNERALALDRATDRLMAAQPQTVGELLGKWFEIVASSPDAHLLDIDPTTLVDFYTRKRVPDGLEVAPPDLAPASADRPVTALPSLDGDGRPVFRLDVKNPQRPAGQKPTPVPLDFWLFSRQDAGPKLAAAAALVIAVGAIGMALLDRRAQAERTAAFQELKASVAAADDAAARRAIEGFRAAHILAAHDPRQDQVERVEPDLGRWPALRRRNALYERMVTAVKASDEVKAAEAARAFQAAAAAGLPDPAVDSQVASVLEWADAMRNRRTRDAAYARLVETRKEKGSDRAQVLRAAEEFLEAPPKREPDPRTLQVLAWYSEAFTDWMTRRAGAGPLDDDARTRITKYGSLASRSSQEDSRP